MIIRPARTADAEGIAHVHVDSWRTTYPGMVPDDYLVSLSERASLLRWRHALTGAWGTNRTFIAEDPAWGIIGFATCGIQRTKLEGFGGEFYALYLQDFAQGQGTGRQLMATMADDLRAVGINSAVVWVLKSNPSRWFYQRLGGMPLAEQPIRFAGADLVEFAYGWKDLAPLARLSVDPQVR
ncbi:MAG TPA: GNAT family N-acetyltransferase [Azospirillaceae bacterium]|nr:GNAT family N-acetyltransferase [Azospirillaceae bacterium]